MSRDRTIKVLVAGNVNGNIKQLCTRVNNVNRKNGPFQLLLIVGRMLGPDIESWVSLRSGSLTLDVPAFILGPDTADHVPYYQHLENGQVADNVTYLGRRGVYTTTGGLSVAYLSGVYDANSTGKAHVYSQCDLDILRAQSGVLNGVDILINGEWPAEVTRHVRTDGITVPAGVAPISELATIIRPRYHFVAGPYYERLPYRNHRILHERAQYCTRFISLDTVGNKDKKKWLYAFNITPMKHLTDDALRKQPVETSENPYLTLEQEKHAVEDRQSQHFYAIGDKRKGSEGGGGGEKKNEKSSCWFCLKSPNVEKHLIVTVGTHMYLALAKGALRTDHIMIIPTSHVKCQQFLSPEQHQEVDAFKKSLCKMNRSLHKATTVFFERSVSTSHLQIHCMPVPKARVNDVKDAFYDFAEKYKLEVQEVPGDDSDWMDVIPASTDYFIAEMENEDKLIFLCPQRVRFPLQFGREVLASEQLLNTPHLVSWKACKQAPDQEQHDAKKFREAFTKFNPFPDDDSDSDG